MRPSELIQHVDKLGLMEAEDLPELARLLEPISFSKGQFLIREGKRAPATFLVIEGSIQVEKALPGKSDRVLVSAIRSGDWIGCVSLLDQQEATASVVATSDVLALAMNRANFENLRANNSAMSMRFGRTVMAGLAQQLVRVNQTVAGLRNALEQR
jgi:CRP-like cAMP-binding protein